MARGTPGRVTRLGPLPCPGLGGEGGDEGGEVALLGDGGGGEGAGDVALEGGGEREGEGEVALPGAGEGEGPAGERVAVPAPPGAAQAHGPLTAASAEANADDVACATAVETADDDAEALPPAERTMRPCSLDSRGAGPREGPAAYSVVLRGSPVEHAEAAALAVAVAMSSSNADACEAATACERSQHVHWFPGGS